MLISFYFNETGVLPVIIRHEKGDEYYRALMKADKGKITDFIRIVAEEVRTVGRGAGLPAEPGPGDRGAESCQGRNAIDNIVYLRI